MDCSLGNFRRVTSAGINSDLDFQVKASLKVITTIVVASHSVVAGKVAGKLAVAGKGATKHSVVAGKVATKHSVVAGKVVAKFAVASKQELLHLPCPQKVEACPHSCQRARAQAHTREEHQCLRRLEAEYYGGHNMREVWFKPPSKVYS